MISQATRPNDIDNGVSFLQHLIVPESENPETSLMQCLIANAILLAVVMLATIHLDDQSYFQAHKVEHKIQERMLAAKFETCDLPTAQALPQAILGISHTAS